MIVLCTNKAITYYRLSFKAQLNHELSFINQHDNYKKPMKVKNTEFPNFAPK